MSLKKLFDKKGSNKVLRSANIDEIADKIESREYLEEFAKHKRAFVPQVDFSNPENFARYGSAVKYYRDSVERIFKTYPYDGSKYEKLEWQNNSLYIDDYILEHRYPRSTGYAIFGNSDSAGYGAQSAKVGDYGLSATKEFVQIKGGPNSGFDPAGERDPEKVKFNVSSKQYFKNANIYDEDQNKTSNLRYDLDEGVTVEFWLKKSEFVSQTDKEVIFDLWNGTEAGSLGYGRLTIELSSSVTDSFRVTAQSSSGADPATGFFDETIGTNLDLIDDQWRHYAISLKNVGSSIETKLYVTGTLNETKTLGTNIGEVTGSLIANIGALRTSPSGTLYDGVSMEGYGKLSGSLDEFRYWKKRRTDEQIKQNWFRQVNGGTNTDKFKYNDEKPVDLGVYYKFNEGIVGDSTIDSTVLDYSGRVSNGAWTGYSTNSRAVGSAINSSPFVVSGSEFKDPIIYSTHPKVTELLDDLEFTGSQHDSVNVSSIYSSIPSWIIEQDQEEDRKTAVLENLTQIMASYFDTLHLQIEALPRIKDVNYDSTIYEVENREHEVSGNVHVVRPHDKKPLPFANRLLGSYGFEAPELFSDATLVEQISSQNDKIKFQEELYNVKNTIYQNIYNNLAYINKSKGTEKSFRNLLRCFGVDEELVKINLYGDNVDFRIEENRRTRALRRKYINFNSGSAYEATIYQKTSGKYTDSPSFIPTAPTASLMDHIPITVESEVILPKSFPVGHTLYVPTGFVTSSLFGVQRANEDDVADFSFFDESIGTNSDIDGASFVVQAVRTKEHSPDVNFIFTGSFGGTSIELTSSVLLNAYNNEKWHLSTRVRHRKIPFVPQVTGTLEDTTGFKPYEVVFTGYNYNYDELQSTFSVSSSLTEDEAVTFLRAPKRLFVGAYRTNFTGSVINKSDAKYSMIRYWFNNLSDDNLKSHAKDVTNFGVNKAYQNAFPLDDTLQSTVIPGIDTLALHWDFQSVEGTDANGNFIVEDMTSGSIAYSDATNDAWLVELVKKNQYIGFGDKFKVSSNSMVVDDYAFVAQQQHPEVLNSADMIQILTRDDEVFTRNTRPVKYFYAIEKSMNQIISEEMLKFFSNIKDFNEMIGSPVHKYREEYKELRKMREVFFEKVDNDPDYDRFIDYFKWIDDAVMVALQQLVPASADISNDVLNIVESHVLERSKIKHSFPLVKPFYATEGPAKGINELLYNWKFGHAPLSEKTDENCLWWKERAERGDDRNSSGDANIDGNRKLILSAAVGDTPIDKEIDRPHFATKASASYIGSTYALTRLSKPLRLKAEFSNTIHGGINYHKNKKHNYIRSTITQMHGETSYSGAPLNVGMIFQNDIVNSQSCNDISQIDPNKKIPIPFRLENQKEIASGAFLDFDYGVGKGQILAPFNLLSSSVTTGYNHVITEGFKSGINLVNLHNDAYGDTAEIPMQGPFTNAHVGGNQHRHVDINQGSDTYKTRSEAFRLLVSCFDTGDPDNECQGSIGIVAADYPQPGGEYPQSDAAVARFYRDGTAKRPVNIANIKFDENSRVIGNYQRNAEIIQTVGRGTNNLQLRKSQGAIPGQKASTFMTGVVDFSVPRRDLTGSNSVFVNKFSNPGGPESMGQGFLGIAGGEVAVYNAQPYRNATIRNALDELSSRHCGQFGIESSLVGTLLPDSEKDADGTRPSFHKVHRNTRNKLFNNASDEDSVITSSFHHNVFVRRPIPSTDLAYSWITSSYIRSTTHVLGYTSASIINRYHEGINFLTASELRAYLDTEYKFGQDENDATTTGDSHIPVDFAGLNTVIVDPITASSNTLGTEHANFKDYLNPEFIKGGLVDNEGNASTAGYLNALLLHRNGPFGYPTWKQIRAGSTPVARKFRKENTYSIIRKPEEFTIISGGRRLRFKPLRGSIIDNFTEPVFTSKYKPMITVDNNAGNQKLLVRHTYGNKFTGFANEKANLSASYVAKPKRLKQDRLFDRYKNTPNNFSYQDYKEVIYPREIHFGLNKVRARENYAEESGTGDNGYDRRIDQRRTFWGADLNRSSGSALNALGYAFGPSKFPLGNERVVIEKRKSATATDAPKSYPIVKTVTGAVQGELSPRFTNQNEDSEGVSDHLNPMAELGALMDETGSLFAGNQSVEIEIDTALGTADGITPTMFYAYLPKLMSDTRYKSQSKYYQDDDPTEYMVPFYTFELAGKNPWYDTYEEYAEEVRTLEKDFSVIPEFRISDHLEHYLDNGEDFLLENNDFLRLDGGEITASANGKEDDLNEDFFDTYVNSDFLQHYNYLVSEYRKTGISPSKISLTCKGVKKLLPYNGFYPVTRLTQIGAMLSQSLGPYLSGSSYLESQAQEAPVSELNEARGLQVLMKHFFAPGIIFNTIKSGIAVDFPMFTSSVATVGTFVKDRDNFFEGGVITQESNYRLPFEAIANLDLLPKDQKIFSVYADKYIGDSPSVTSASYEGRPASLVPAVVWKGRRKKKYELAMNNFLAESANFFLKRRGFTTFQSAPENQFKAMEKGKSYYMDVVLRKTDDFDMIRSYYSSSLLLTGASATSAEPEQSPHLHPLSYHGRYFGPPVQYRSIWSGSNAEADATAPSAAENIDPDARLTRAINYADPAYAPYTPPYFYGASKARIKVTIDSDTDETKVYSLDEILAKAVVGTAYSNTAQDGANGQLASGLFRRYLQIANDGNYDASHIDTGSAGYPAEQAMMHLSSSLNIFGKTRVKQVQYDAEGNPISFTDPETSAFDTWVVSSKYECPTLNFKDNLNQFVDEPDQPVHGAKGMWIGYGDFPEDSEGIFMSLEESFPGQRTTDPLTGSLLEVCGFKPSRERIGEVALKRELFEAVVAIPYVKNEKDTERFPNFAEVTDKIKNRKFYKIDREIMFEQLLNKEKTSITDLNEKMDQFHIPPEFNWKVFGEIDPFVMYIFPFKTTFDRQDLADIWQSVMPKPALKAEKEDVILEHSIGEQEFFHGKDLHPETKWMVFKIKQKAQKDYFDKVADSSRDNRFKFDFAIGEDKKTEYGYNYPYDFCSLVETAKLEVGVRFELEEEEKE